MENHKHHTVNALIVGQGLAGSLLFWELHRRGLSVAVVDEGLAVTSSKIAAGMFNPVNTKRFTVSANAEKLIPEVLNMYESIETELGISIIHKTPVLNVFGNYKEGNDYSAKLDHPFFKQYTHADPLPEAHILQPFGSFETTLSGWIDLKVMLSAMRSYIRQKAVLIEDVFNYESLKAADGKWVYGNIVTDRIIFCEGYQGNKNPFFTDLHIIPCKGDVLEFEAPDLQLTRVVKKGIYIVQIGEGKFRCGSTYQWENDDATPKLADKEELMQKISELIDVPFTVTSHQVAIRPTTKTREVIVKQHPEFSNMYALNGLGTKGVINGVKAVRQIIETLGI